MQDRISQRVKGTAKIEERDQEKAWIFIYKKKVYIFCYCMLFDNLTIRSLPAAEIVMGGELLNWGGGTNDRHN